MIKSIAFKLAALFITFNQSAFAQGMRWSICPDNPDYEYIALERNVISYVLVPFKGAVRSIDSAKTIKNILTMRTEIDAICTRTSQKCLDKKGNDITSTEILTGIPEEFPQRWTLLPEFRDKQGTPHRYFTGYLGSNVISGGGYYPGEPDETLDIYRCFDILPGRQSYYETYSLNRLYVYNDRITEGKEYTGSLLLAIQLAPLKLRKRVRFSGFK